MQENVRGGEEDSSPACCSRCVSLTPWSTQQVSCDGTLEYFYIPHVPKMSFGEESTRTDRPNFPPQRFLTKAIQTARKSRQRRTKWWVGLKMDLKNFWPAFSSVITLPPKSLCDVFALSVLAKLHYSVGRGKLRSCHFCRANADHPKPDWPR